MLKKKITNKYSKKGEHTRSAKVDSRRKRKIFLLYLEVGLKNT